MAYNGEVAKKSGINPMAKQYNRTSAGAGEAVLERKRTGTAARTGHAVIVKKKVKAKTPFPISFIFYCITITVMLMFIAYSYSVVNDISYEIGELEESIAVNKEENERLSLELDKKNDLTFVEKEATERLGMVKSTEVVKHYVSISGGDKVVVSEENKNSGAVVTTLDGIKNAMGKLYK